MIPARSFARVQLLFGYHYFGTIQPLGKLEVERSLFLKCLRSLAREPLSTFRVDPGAVGSLILGSITCRDHG